MDEFESILEKAYKRVDEERKSGYFGDFAIFLNRKTIVYRGEFHHDGFCLGHLGVIIFMPNMEEKVKVVRAEGGVGTCQCGSYRYNRFGKDFYCALCGELHW